jgi:hypothetical protein
MVAPQKAGRKEKDKKRVVDDVKSEDNSEGPAPLSTGPSTCISKRAHRG